MAAQFDGAALPESEAFTSSLKGIEDSSWRQFAARAAEADSGGAVLNALAEGDWLD